MLSMKKASDIWITRGDRFFIYSILVFYILGSTVVDLALSLRGSKDFIFSIILFLFPVLWFALNLAIYLRGYVIAKKVENKISIKIIIRFMLPIVFIILWLYGILVEENLLFWP